MKNLKTYLAKAKKNKWGIGQFNFSTIEQLKGILEAVKILKSPAILGTSEKEVNFLGLRQIIALVSIYKSEDNIPVFLNLDHGKDLNLIKQAIDYGYDAIHFDGSKLSLKENIKQTKKIVEYAHKKNVLVEGEIDMMKGDSGFHSGKTKIKGQKLTSPDKVEKFIQETKADSLAIAIGSLHGIYKQNKKLDIDLLEKINKISNGFLVLHGGSGIPSKEIKKAINNGITKINFNTELRLIWKKSLIKQLQKGNELKPYNILPFVSKKTQDKVEEKMILLNSKNKL